MTRIESSTFRLVNDPGYWGASDPVVLVLGQSKGRTQWRAWGREFDEVAFAGSRDRLRAVLERIGVVIDHTDVDACFRSTERDLGFASLVRCSLSRDDGGSSGSPVVAAMASPADVWVRTCMQRWLGRFNPRLRLVVLLGITDAYVHAVLARLEALHPESFHRSDPTTAWAAGVVWTFAQHPSPLAINHYRSWIGEEPSVKRDAACRAVRFAFEAATPVAASSGDRVRPRGSESRSISSTAAGPAMSGRPASADVPPTAQAIRELLDNDPELVRHGALAQDNKKMSDWCPASRSVPLGRVLNARHRARSLRRRRRDRARESARGGRGRPRMICYKYAGAGLGVARLHRKDKLCHEWPAARRGTAQR